MKKLCVNGSPYDKKLITTAIESGAEAVLLPKGKTVPRARRDAIQAAAEYGIDIAMLRANLRRTPADRIRRHQIALETFRMLRRSKRI